MNLREANMKMCCSIRRLLLLLVVCMVGFTASGAPQLPEMPPKPQPATTAEQPRVIIGRIEFVVVRDAHLRLKARIDTGAGLSSVDAKILEIIKTDTGERVRFQLQDAEGKTKTLERDVVGWANIKIMGSDEKNRRPIVKLSICLGGKRIKGRVNLNDRSNYLYPMLIGRNLLNTGKYLIDPSQLYMQEPGCK
jgi:hypothetical protein